MLMLHMMTSSIVNSETIHIGKAEVAEQVTCLTTAPETWIWILFWTNLLPVKPAENVSLVIWGAECKMVEYDASHIAP